MSKYNLMDTVLGNGSRPWKYKVNMSVPSSISTNFGISYNETVDTLVYNTELPELKLNTISFDIDGKPIHIPGMRETNNTWKATFYLDESLSIRRMMEFWLLAADSSLSFSGEKSPAVLGDSILNGLGKIVNNGVSYGLSALSNFSPFLGDLAGDILGVLKSTIDDIRGEIILTQYTYNGEVAAVYTLHNAFPVGISSVNLSNDAIDKISEVTVTFSYTHFDYSKPQTLSELAIDAVTSLF